VISWRVKDFDEKVRTNCGYRLHTFQNQVYLIFLISTSFMLSSLCKDAL
jgi:hypothetical protein